METELKTEFMLYRNTQLISNLNKCKKYVNTPNWHIYCKFICEKFQLN